MGSPMMSYMIPYIHALFDWIILSTLQASPLVCLILVLRLVMRHRMHPYWRSALWLLVFFRLSLPSLPESDLSICNLVPHQQSVWTKSYADLQSGPQGSAEDAGDAGMSGSAAFVEVAVPHEVPPVVRLPLTPLTVMGLVWFGGAALIIGFAVWQAILLAVRMRRGGGSRHIVDRRLLNQLEECRSIFNIRVNIDLYETHHANVPSLYGSIRPRLIFPSGMLEQLSRRELRHVILHELAHHKRRDILRNWWMMLARAVYWFNPLVWMANSAARTDAELACDAMVLARGRDVSPDEYGSTLVRLLEASSRSIRHLAPASVFRNRREITTRLQMIMAIRRTSLLSTIALAAITLGLAGVFLTSARGETERGMTNVQNVKRVDGRVWIENLASLAGWGKGEENTYIGSLRLALSASREDFAYDQLMGYSGAAFRLQIAQPDWCPSAPDGKVGFDVSIPVMKSIGYRAKSIEDCDIFAWIGINRMKNAIVEHIDKGHPLVAINLDGGMDWGVIVGYENDGKTLLCRTYDNPDGDYVAAKETPCVVEILEKSGSLPDQKERVLESLRVAVNLANTTSFDGYASGFAAYEAWIRDLLDDKRYEELPSRDLSGMVQPNAWCYYSLCDARAAATRYLSSTKSVFDGEAYTHLSQAEEWYQQIATRLLSDQRHAPFPHQLNGEQWTKEMRHTEASALREALALERKAIKAIEAALAIMNQT